MSSEIINTTQSASVQPTANEILVHSSSGRSDNSNTDGPPLVRFLHYNDVYHVEPGSMEPVGGVARLKTLFNYYRDDERFGGSGKREREAGGEKTEEVWPEVLTFFSGDAFNPSLESSVTKGSHMVPFLNKLNTNCACVGNHDLDFGVVQFQHLAKQCTFPWLLANVLDPALGDDVSLGNCPKTHMITTSNGIKIGLIGLVEREWLDTINSLPPDLIYKSVSATAAELVPGLRKQGAELVIAITHQREPNDNKLASKTPPGLIDIVLGGHDHFYNHSIINGTHVLRSGTDFKQMSYIEARRKKDGSRGWDFDIFRRDAVREISEDQDTLELVSKLTDALKYKLEKPMGYTAVPLDARFKTVRLKESNLGNFVCDLMKNHYRGDCALMAAGTIRGDQIYPPGMLKLKDIMNCFPFEDPVVVIRVTGKALMEALENSVCKYPALEGRFPQVSSIKFTFDTSQKDGSRIKSVAVGGEPIQLDKKYVLVTRGYMARGKDGYKSLTVQSEGGEAEEIVSEENGILISMLLRQYFLSLKVLRRWTKLEPSMGRHWKQVQKDLQPHCPLLEASSSQPKEQKVISDNVLKNAEESNKIEKLKKPNNSKQEHEKQGINQDERANLSLKTNSFMIKDAKNCSRCRSEDRHRKGSRNYRQQQHDDGDDSSADSESDDDTDLSHVKPVSAAIEQRDRELVVIRRVMRKWRRLSGLKEDPRTCDGLGEGEFTASWTRAIAPRLEGRINIVQA